MDLSAPHIAFVVASYIVSGATIVSLVIATLVKLKMKERQLSELETLGKRRGGAGDER